GCTEVFLEVRTDNDRAQRLYRRYGFVGIGVRRGYYQPSGAGAPGVRPVIAPGPPARAAAPARGRPGGARGGAGRGGGRAPSGPQAPGHGTCWRASGTTQRQRCPGAEDAPPEASEVLAGAPPARRTARETEG